MIVLYIILALLVGVILGLASMFGLTRKEIEIYRKAAEKQKFNPAMQTRQTKLRY